MANREIDPAAADERAAWDSVANAWRKWWPQFETGAQALNERLVELAGVAAGHRVLDVATGIGEPSVTAARVAGPSGHVLACDLSGTMIEIARERAADLGLANIVFDQQDASHLDAGTEPFHAAVCRWGLMLMLEPEAAARNVHRVLAPGARFATAVWDHPEHVPFIALSGRVLRRELDLPPPNLDEPGPFRYREPGSLAGLLASAGFQDVATESFTVEMVYDSPRNYCDFVREVSSSARKLLATADDATRDRLLEILADEARSYADTAGRVRFENRVICAVGTRR